MRIRLVIVTACIVAALFAGFQFKEHSVKDKEVFSNALIRYGATGGDVYELQGRLKFLGFYFGAVDGDYGWKTLHAVRNFQYRFGLRVDGLVGPRTKLRLWEATRPWRPTAPAAGGGARPARGGATISRGAYTGVSENEIRMMANAVHGESRGEPYVGQVAVAAVIVNRTQSPQFPKTTHGVIFQPGAFTAVADGQIWLTPNPTARRAVMDALNGWDPTGGCIYYFNPATATSKWIWGRPQVKKIGRHIFCK